MPLAFPRPRPVQRPTVRPLAPSAAVDMIPPEITGVTSDADSVSFDLSEPGTVYMLRNASATPLTGTAIKAGAEYSGAVVEGANDLTIDDAAWSVGTHYLHFAAEDAAANITTTGSVVTWTKAGGIQYVGGKTAVFAGTTTDPAAISLTDLTGGLASAPADGDLVLIHYAIGAGVDVDVTITTSDYIEIADLRANDDNDANLGVFRKFMTSTPDTSVTVGPTTNATYAGAVAIQVFRGVNATTPLDVTSTTATGLNTGIATPPAITPTTSGAVIVCSGSAANAAGAVFTNSDLSNFITATSPDTIDATVGAGTHDWTSGTFTPAAWGGSTSASTDSWAAVTLALRPA